MNIEDIRKAKQECRSKIIDALNELQERTGIPVDEVDVDFVDISTGGSPGRKMIGNVHIRMQI